MQQYFVKETLDLNQIVSLDMQQSFHISKVMRMKEEDTIVVVDGAKIAYEATLRKVGPVCTAEMTDRLERDNEMNAQVTVVMALIK